MTFIKILYEAFKRMDKILPHDKCLHYIIGAWLFILMFLLSMVFTDKDLSLFIAGILVIIIAEVKEYMDYITNRGTLSFMDGIATLFGAMTIGVMLYWF